MADATKLAGGLTRAIDNDVRGEDLEWLSKAEFAQVLKEFASLKAPQQARFIKTAYSITGEKAGGTPRRAAFIAFQETVAAPNPTYAGYKQHLGLLDDGDVCQRGMNREVATMKLQGDGTLSRGQIVKAQASELACEAGKIPGRLLSALPDGKQNGWETVGPRWQEMVPKISKK